MVMVLMDISEKQWNTRTLKSTAKTDNQWSLCLLTKSDDDGPFHDHDRNRHFLRINDTDICHDANVCAHQHP